MKFLTHDCQIILYGVNVAGQCGKQTQTRCDVCRRWCCAMHRHDLKRDLEKKITLCHQCIEDEEEE